MCLCLSAIWGCRDETSSNVLLNKASNLLVGQSSSVGCRKARQSDPPCCHTWGTCGVMLLLLGYQRWHPWFQHKKMPKGERPPAAKPGPKVRARQKLVELQWQQRWLRHRCFCHSILPLSRRADYSPTSEVSLFDIHSTILVHPTAEASVRLDMLPQVSWPRNRVHSRTCQSPHQLRTAAHLQDTQKQTPHWWTRSDVGDSLTTMVRNTKFCVCFFFIYLFKYCHHHFNTTNSSKIWSINDAQKSSLWEDGGFWVFQLLAKIIISPIVFLGKMQQLWLEPQLDKSTSAKMTHEGLLQSKTLDCSLLIHGGSSSFRVTSLCSNIVYCELCIP